MNETKIKYNSAKLRQKYGKPLWMTRGVKRSINSKLKLFKRYVRYRSRNNYNEYVWVRNECKSHIREAVKSFEIKLEEECKTNVKGLWTYINTKHKTKIDEGSLRRKDGSGANSDREKEDVLNDFLSSVFVKKDIANIPPLGDLSNGDYLSDILITQRAIYDKLNTSDVTKSTDPDYLHPGY